MSLNSYQGPTGIPVTIPVNAGIWGFAGIPVPVKFHCRDAGILHKNCVIKTSKILQSMHQKCVNLLFCNSNVFRLQVYDIRKSK